jgi:chromosome segregation ATPase
MKPKPFLAACVAAVGLTGCAETDPPDLISQPLTNVSAREVRRETREAADAARQFTAENRDKLLASTEAKLKECGQKIADFEAKLASLAYDYNAKAEGTKALDALREKRTQLGQQLEKLRECSEETWQDAKAAVETAAEEVDKSYDNAKSKFKD